MNRVAFLVDGYNVYHSLREAHDALGRPVEWLDLHSLCGRYVATLFARDAILRSVTYFSAHASPRAVSSAARARHRSYVQALEATGVETIMGRFKLRSRRCPNCGKEYTTQEEKETDVAIAVRIVELAQSRDCETIVVVTGDTDVIPALRAAKGLTPEKHLWVASPFKRYHRALRESVENGLAIHKPSGW